MGSRTIHMCIDVRGLLKYPARDFKRACRWFSGPEGHPTPGDLREYLLDKLAAGNEVLPYGQCPDFDPKTGCRGHAEPADAGEEGRKP